jgi:flagellar hook assembly protein FlgD
MSEVRSDLGGLSSDLCIYDLSGRLVRSLPLPNAYFLPHTGLEWNGEDDKGRALPPGIYFLSMDGIPPQKLIKVK